MMNTLSSDATRMKTGAARGAWLLATWLTLAGLATACSHEPEKVQVLAVDRTSIARSDTAWPAEVAAMARQEVAGAFAAGAGELHLIGIGSGPGDTAQVAVEKLDTDCPNTRVCEDDRQALADNIARVAAEVAARPVRVSGTDIFSAVRTALGLCAGRPCRISLLTDGLDERLFGNGSVDELLARYANQFPALKGAVVHLDGLGAGTAAKSERLSRDYEFWTQLLTHAGAVDVRVGRSL